jgi:hypothetical protein
MGSSLQANLAVNKQRQGDMSVEPELRAALGLALSRSQEMHAMRCLEGLVEFGIASGKAEQALADADPLAALAERGGMPEVLARARRWRGEAMLELGQLDRAEGELSCALAAFTVLGTPRLQCDVHLALARLCHGRGHDTAARQHQELANDVLVGIAAGVPDAELRVGLAKLAAQGD